MNLHKIAQAFFVFLSDMALTKNIVACEYWSFNSLIEAIKLF